MSKELFTTTVESVGPLKMKCSSRNFSFYLDEPEHLGGKNEAMTPVEALLSAFGACQSMVAKFFASAHKINLIDIKIDLEGELDLDGIKGINKNAKIGFSKITSKFYIKADNTEQEIRDFIAFVERNCPIRDTIINTPEIVTEVYPNK
ncbi:OsmC family protein [Xenorhabdus sp. DI]|uniref:OsmC family protein n=1 Tax=Xenorhabdus doucetiae TaxID=351671 RepID=UPI001986BF75|nr:MULTISPECIES: OsmC family protein [unclassified Xenorhabdus]MBD2784602.1 OsmC family protein [Xenorhabdus sp. 3]MBD2788301.1 OsmC family protein [Xenorhabdus sp. DI]